MLDAVHLQDFNEGFFGGHFHGASSYRFQLRSAGLFLNGINATTATASQQISQYLHFIRFIFRNFCYLSAHERAVRRIETARFAGGRRRRCRIPRRSQNWRRALACRSQPCIAGSARSKTAGLLQRTLDGRRFELAPRASQLAFSILGNRPGGTIRHEILQRVVQEVGEACNLTVLDGTQVTYLDRVEAEWLLRIIVSTGIESAGLLLGQRQTVSGA